MTTELGITNYLIMQNKPNFLQHLMSISPFITNPYGNYHLLGRRKNKPNSNPIKPNRLKTKMNTTFCLTNHYEQKNTAPPSSQTKPKQTQFKPNFKTSRNFLLLIKLVFCAKIHILDIFEGL